MPQGTFNALLVKWTSYLSSKQEVKVRFLYGVFMGKAKKKIKAIAVRFDEDLVSALYLDGKYATMNNDYDDDADLSFESFIDGVISTGKDVDTIEWLSVYSEDDEEDFPSNDGTNIPDIWPDGKFSERVVE